MKPGARSSAPFRRDEVEVVAFVDTVCLLGVLAWRAGVHKNGEGHVRFFSFIDEMIGMIAVSRM